MTEARPTLLPAMAFGVASCMLVAFGALGFVVRIGPSTLTAKDAACFVVLGVLFGAASFGYATASALLKPHMEGGAVLVADGGGCVLATLAMPMVIASGVFAALGLAQVVQGSAVGAGLLAPAAVVLIGAALLLDARYVVRQLEDQSLVVSAGRLLLRERHIAPARFDRVYTSQRMYRGRLVYVVTLSLRGGGEVNLGRWFSAVEAENVAGRVSR